MVGIVWTRAVWDIGNGYIYQYHLSILGTDNLYCFFVCVLTINRST